MTDHQNSRGNREETGQQPAFDHSQDQRPCSRRHAGAAAPQLPLFAGCRVTGSSRPCTLESQVPDCTGVQWRCAAPVPRRPQLSILATRRRNCSPSATAPYPCGQTAKHALQPVLCIVRCRYHRGRMRWPLGARCAFSLAVRQCGMPCGQGARWLTGCRQLPHCSEPQSRN